MESVRPWFSTALAVGVAGLVGSLGCRSQAAGPERVSRVRRAYGEAPSGFPSWKERMIQVLVNRARADPITDLQDCTNCADKDCYTEALPPLVWDEHLNRSARFHAWNLTDSGCGMQHDSPCTLVSNIGQLYPDQCDGSVSCACVGGTANCSSGFSFADRLRAFGVSGTVGENIAGSGDPVDVFYLWLHESTSDPSCNWRLDNGHRWNILSADYRSIGVGVAGGYTVQDFWGSGSSMRIPAGAHYPERGTQIEFRANWYDAEAPLGAYVNIEGTCHQMTVERGTARNGTFLYQGQVPGQCTRYFFVFYDAMNEPVFYPDTGSFGIGCSFDWTEERPPLGPGCGCEPSCAGRECGDDGCGGSCGDCQEGLVCRDGTCGCPDVECAGVCCGPGEVCFRDACCLPDCGGRECGDDGCGGSCGNCAPGLLCTGAGQCGNQCEEGLSPCDGLCVDLASDPQNCGRCGGLCGPDEECVGGQCVCTTCGDAGGGGDGGAGIHVVGGCGCRSADLVGGGLMPMMLMVLLLLLRRRRR